MGLLGEDIRCARIIGNIEKNEFRMRAVIKEVRKLPLNVCVGLEYGPGKADSDQTSIPLSCIVSGVVHEWTQGVWGLEKNDVKSRGPQRAAF